MPQATAVVLLSGGLDSTVTAAQAIADGFAPTALTIDYGQRHRIELGRAAGIAAALHARHIVLPLDLAAFGGSALTDPAIAVPKTGVEPGIPVTYVPARNTVFLALALALAEASGARHIYAGMNAVDYSGYPDCRPAFVAAFQTLANLATKAGVEGDRFHVVTPVIASTKAEIIRLGIALGAPLHLSWSCYDPDDNQPCGRCDSCRLRAQGFAEAGIADPALA